jgi:hypothetical protein
VKPTDSQFHSGHCCGSHKFSPKTACYFGGSATRKYPCQATARPKWLSPSHLVSCVKGSIKTQRPDSCCQLHVQPLIGPCESSQSNVYQPHPIFQVMPGGKTSLLEHHYWMPATLVLSGIQSLGWVTKTCLVRFSSHLYCFVTKKTLMLLKWQFG